MSLDQIMAQQVKVSAKPAAKKAVVKGAEASFYSNLEDIMMAPKK